ncbi:HD-GYP domain-containing protein [Sphingomonas sp.]|uniref:HD-GYP domain-containing protein n=1 Tax=Sphingomonas sp. TaxID=28214 RepID=UPI001B095FF7|nr:HD domain-containing protein [Sphingomonas sp.]MBO9712622.1 HD domain-containing protein [Sphingomonas sp.]
MRHAFPAEFGGIAGTTTTSLAEILGAFSYALDLTEGQPEGHALRSCWIASRMAAALGLSAEERRTVYYATLLKDLGCSSNAARVAELYLADDRAIKQGFKLIPQGLASTLRFVFSRTGAGGPLRARTKAILTILRNGEDLVHELIETRCMRGADIARQLRFPEPVALAVAALDEHWDGTGKPLGLRGTAVPVAARLALLAQIADVFNVAGGPQAARAEVEARSGSWFDPELVGLFLTMSKDTGFWADLADPALEQRLRGFEPAEVRVAVDDDYLDDIAAAFGAVIDAKSPFTGGHSERVGNYAAALGERLDIPADHRRAVRRAAMLHDVGKLGVSSRVLEKPGKLDAVEWAEMRSHAVHTMAILGRIAPLREMATIAGAHHERLDGRGYPLGLDEMLIARESRIITVCDFFDALTADRPYRPAMSRAQALEVMAGEVGRAIDAEVFAALREVVG